MAKKITKKEIIREIANDTGLPANQVKMVWDAMFTNIIYFISQGNRVSVDGFGTFICKKRAPRTGRNPHTGEAVPIPARVVTQFIPGEHMKAAANKQEGK